MKAILAATVALTLAIPAAATAQIHRAVDVSGSQTASLMLIDDDDDDDDRRRHRHRGHYKRDRGDDRDDRRHYRRGYREDSRHAYRPGYYGGHDGGYRQHRRWSRGQVIPYEYRRQMVHNYYDYGYGPPPRGCAYYRTDSGQVVLAAIATGLILSVLGGY
jgi:Ni/Co efflux regulator RcnB